MSLCPVLSYKTPEMHGLVFYLVCRSISIDLSYQLDNCITAFQLIAVSHPFVVLRFFLS